MHEVLVGVTIAAHVAAGLVAVAGASKIARPGAARRSLGLRDARWASWLVRAIGVGEVSLAALVVTLGGRPAFTALALAYAAFVVVSARQRRAGRSCGCFGASDVLVGPLHLALDVVAFHVAAAAAVWASPSLPASLPEGAVATLTTLVLVVVAVVLGQLSLTSLPDTLAARRLAVQGLDR